MLNSTQQKITQSAHSDYDWKPDDIRVDEVESLRQGECAVFTAATTARPTAIQANYAVLKGDLVIGGSEKNAAARILESCGEGAPAGWKAEIIARFHPDLGGVVLTTASNPGALRKVQAAGKTLTDPVAAGGTVSFFMLEPESFTVSQVKATHSGVALTVEVTELR